MKRIIILTILIVFTLCGCSNNDSTVKEKVKVNFPKDNTVNGYRKEPKKNNSNSGMLNTISGIDITFEETESNDTSSKIVNNDKNVSYCGNKNSKKFHKSSCGALKNTKEENKVYLGSKEDFLSQGYSGCKMCKP